MRSLTKVVLPIAIVIGLIGGVTFVSQYSGRTNDKKPTPILGDAVQKPDLLVFPVKEGTWEDPDDTRKRPPYVAEFEVDSKGHYDFWFWNTTAAPVRLQWTYKSCTCAQVRFGLPTAQGAKQLIGTAAAPLAATSVLGQLATEFGVRESIDKEIQWQELDRGEPLTVPAAEGAASPGIGLVRLIFEAKSPEPVLLRVTLLASQDGKGEEIVLTLPVMFVRPVRLDKQELQVPEISARGQKETVTFRCWSSTRDNFPLKVADEKGNPCIVCDWQPLTEPERHELARDMKFQTRVRSGYRVSVTVHERRSEKELLDLGPFHRRLLVTAAEDGHRVALSGMVKGEVTLRSADNKEYIDLGPFKAARGTSKPVTLMSEQPGLRLKVVSSSPDYLAVTLGEPKTVDGVQRWELTVAVPAGRSGRLPNDSAVILETQGESGRRMRIPVTGEAIQ